MRGPTFAVCVGLVLTTGCSSMKPETFADAEPRFVIEEYFAGHTTAWGIFEDRFGDLRRQFKVEITGTWDGRQLVLDEAFSYSDGETDRRVWTVTKVDDHTYSGTAGDVVGEAVGKSYGNALYWRYTMDLKAGDRTWRVDFDDWMFLQPNHVLINRARVSKWGIKVGEVTLVFAKPATRIDAPQPAARVWQRAVNG